MSRKERITVLQVPPQVPFLSLPAPKYPSPPDPVGADWHIARESESGRSSAITEGDAADDEDTTEDDAAADDEEAHAGRTSRGSPARAEEADSAGIADSAGGADSAPIPVFGPLRSRG